MRLSSGLPARLASNSMQRLPDISGHDNFSIMNLSERLLDVPIPAIYGPSADENPFATA